MLRTEKTNRKYAEFIKDCAKEKTFSIKKMLSKHKVDASIITTMRQENLIVSVSADTSNWTGSIPNEGLVSQVIDMHRQRAVTYRLARESKKKLVEESVPEKGLDIPLITEEQAVLFLKSLGCYEIYKVERKQL
jgi:hypothetical protein